MMVRVMSKMMGIYNASFSGMVGRMQKGECKGM